METKLHLPFIAGAALLSPNVLAQVTPKILPPDRPLVQSPDLSELGPRLSSKPLTIDEAVMVALVTSRPLAQARANLFVFQGRTSEAYAALNPTLGSALDAIQLNDSVQNKTLTVLDPHNFNKPIGAEVVTSNLDQKLMSITANLPVDISGSIRAATSKAKFEEIGFRIDVDRTRNQIVADVKAAFYDALRAQALVKVAEEDLRNTQDRLKDAEDRLAARVVTKFDVLRAQTDVAASQQQLIVARNTAITNLAILNSVIGVKIDSPLQVSNAGAIVEPPSQGGAAVLANGVLGPDFDFDLKEALADRPELQEAIAFEEAARKGIDVARRTELPSLNFSWSYLYAPNAGGSNPLVHTWQAQALFTVPIFDGGLARARMKEAKGALAGAEVIKRQATDQVTLETEQAFLSLSEARQRVSVANATLAEATEAYSLARVRYKAGVTARAGLSPLLELSDSQTALTLAESNQVNALYDYNSAQARLDRALGRYAREDRKVLK